MEEFARILEPEIKGFGKQQVLIKKDYREDRPQAPHSIVVFVRHGDLEHNLSLMFKDIKVRDYHFKNIDEKTARIFYETILTKV